jgi:hypothetical protein
MTINHSFTNILTKEIKIENLNCNYMGKSIISSECTTEKLLQDKLGRNIVFIRNIWIEEEEKSKTLKNFIVFYDYSDNQYYIALFEGDKELKGRLFEVDPNLLIKNEIISNSTINIINSCYQYIPLIQNFISEEKSAVFSKPSNDLIATASRINSKLIKHDDFICKLLIKTHNNSIAEFYGIGNTLQSSFTDAYIAMKICFLGYISPMENENRIYTQKLLKNY